MARAPGENSIGLFVILAFAVFGLALSLVTTDYVRKASVAEARNIEQELGASTLSRINVTADGWYLKTLNRWFGSAGAETWLSDDPAQRRREETLIAKNSKLTAWLEQRKTVLLDLGYWILRRVALFVIWLPLWIPLVILSVWHGLQDREIKKTDFGYTSPVLNHWARRVMNLVTVLTALLFLSPVALEPLMFPLMTGCWAVAAGVAVGNVQKRI